MTVCLGVLILVFTCVYVCACVACAHVFLFIYIAGSNVYSSMFPYRVFMCTHVWSFFPLFRKKFCDI